MSGDYWGDEEPEWEPPRDTKIDQAKAVLLDRFFRSDMQAVYYGRQLEIALEKPFFHWITGNALTELRAQGTVAHVEEIAGPFRANFYWPRKHRYPRKQIRGHRSLIERFSSPVFTAALGDTGEQLIDAGFARIGFRILQKKVKEVDGREWPVSGHDLDRLVVRDGVRYGVEIKNRLQYIGKAELDTKLAMCAAWNIRPLFVARMMPANYIHQVRRAGGFSLLMQNQHYPLLAGDLANEVRERLGLPVLCIRELPDTTLRRFEAWHEKHLQRSP